MMRFYNCKINKYQNTEDLSPKELAELGFVIAKAKDEVPAKDATPAEKEDAKKVDKK